MVAVATGHDPLAVREWPTSLLAEVEHVLEDQADKARISAMKKAG